MVVYQLVICIYIIDGELAVLNTDRKLVVLQMIQEF